MMAKPHRKGQHLRGEERAVSERTCIVHRITKTPDEMLRFVVDPNNVVVPDLKSLLPGRGVWVSARREDIDFAVGKGLFARSFRKKLVVESEMGAQIDAALEMAGLKALSLAAKAGLVVTGFEKVQAMLGKRELRALLFALDGADGGVRKIRQKVRHDARAQEIALHQNLRSEPMSLALGRSNVIHAALLKGGASEMCLKALHRLDVYRGSDRQDEEMGIQGHGGAEGKDEIKLSQ